MAETFTPSEAPWREDDPFLANPYDFYAWGREHSPLRVDTARSGAWGDEVGRINERVAVQFGRGHGVWFVFRHDQCVEISRDHDHWTMEPRAGQYDLDPETGERLPRTVGLLNSDPPEHTRLRSLVAEAFTPKTVERLAPRIREIAEELLDTVPGDGRFDLVEAFSHPLPVIVIAEILGVPSSDRAKFKQWSDEAIIAIETRGRGPGRYPLGGRAFPALRSYFTELIEARRREPRDDLISGLVRAEVEGSRLTGDELIHLLILLLVAGNETTRDLIGNTVLALLEHPVGPVVGAERDRGGAALQRARAVHVAAGEGGHGSGGRPDRAGGGGGAVVRFGEPGRAGLSGRGFLRHPPGEREPAPDVRDRDALLPGGAAGAAGGSGRDRGAALAVRRHPARGRRGPAEDAEPATPWGAFAAAGGGAPLA